MTTTVIDLLPAAEETARLTLGVTDEQLALPTPCAGWSVADLLAHLDLVATGAATAHVATRTGRAELGERLHDLGERWREPDAWEGESDGGGLVLANATWGRIALTELVVHGWDLARATGQSAAYPEDTLRVTLEHVRAFVPVAPLPQLWGDPGTPSSDAPLLDHVVAATGRHLCAARS